MGKKVRLDKMNAVIAVYILLVILFLGEALFTPGLNYAFSFVGNGGTFRYSRFQIGDMQLSLYWISYIVGFTGMIMMCIGRAPKYEIARIAAVISAVLLLIFGYAGAKFLYVAEEWNYVQENGLSLSGVSLFGTVFFLPFVIPMLALLFRKSPSLFLDYCTPACLVMIVCIRTGCFLNGCCNGVTLWAMDHPVTIPAQLIECVLDLCLLKWILWKEKDEKNAGMLYFYFMGGYGVLRFFVEFIRDTPKNKCYLSNGQWFSLCAILIAAFVLHVKRAGLFTKKRGR